MGVRLTLNSVLLVLLSSFCLKARAESSGSVVFVQGSSGKYLHNQPLDSDGVRKPISVPEVAGVVSVLLGFAPDFSLATVSSSKLNEVLMPNPFDRPHAVFLLEVSGLDDIDYSKFEAQTILKDKLVGSKASLHLPGEEDVFVYKIEESLEGESNAAFLDEEFTNLANLLEGSYSGSVASMDGKLTFPLASGGALCLHVAREAELHFASSLVALVRGIKRGVEFHEDFSGTILNPAELITGHFTGFKALQEEYVSSEIIQQGMEILQITLSKLFDILHRAYEGKIVGVIVYNKEESGMIEVTSSARISRWLEETSASSDNSTTDSEVLLVRRSLAWITGIILLVSTLSGVCMLMNMPLTRDTLLYSNVKLD